MTQPTTQRTGAGTRDGGGSAAGATTDARNDATRRVRASDIAAVLAPIDRTRRDLFRGGGDKCSRLERRFEARERGIRFAGRDDERLADDETEAGQKR